MISSQSAIKQYILTSPSQQSRTLDLQSLLSSCSPISSSIPPLSTLALTAISNGLQNAKMLSSTPMPSSNTLQPNLPIYSSNVPTVGPSLGQMVSNLPAVRPSLSPMPSGAISMAPSLSQMPSNFPIASPNTHTAGVDVSVLNNLAIALQLMILNNILSMSHEDSEQNSACSNTELVDSFPNPIKPISVSHMPANNIENQNTNVATSKNEDLNQLLNANFLGSSKFADNSMLLQNFGGNPVLQGCTKTSPNSRTGFTLMSPYEALGPNSPFSDPILSSPYALTSGRSSFNSPYSSLEPYSGFDSDLFSMTDIL